MYARAALATLLLARMPPRPLPSAPKSAEAADSAALLTVAFSRAFDSAVSDTAPPASTSESTM